MKIIVSYQGEVQEILWEEGKISGGDAASRVAYEAGLRDGEAIRIAGTGPLSLGEHLKNPYAVLELTGRIMTIERVEDGPPIFEVPPGAVA